MDMCSEFLVVQTDAGKIRGSLGGSHDVRVFKGVPYAKAPVGTLRWREPQPVEPWEGILEALEYGPDEVQTKCPPQDKDNYIPNNTYSEDCLKLNIWAPAKPERDTLYPIAVYVFGGGFQGGTVKDPAICGEVMATKGIVVVTMTYRTGVFGFFPHRDLQKESVNNTTGNYGLLDIVASIDWIRRNSAAFGADPDNVTLFGQSAGGRAVYDLCSSDILKGKIKHAIILSGGGLSTKSREGSFLPYDVAIHRGEAWLDAIGVNSIEEARAIPGEELYEKYKEARWLFDDRAPFRPAIDGYVLKGNPNDSFKNGHALDIQYMIGCTANECDPPRHPWTEDKEAFKAKTQALYGAHWNEFWKVANADNLEDMVKNQKIEFYEKDLAGCYALCENQLQLGRKPAYQYYFTQVPPGSPEGIGAFHSGDLPYVFNSLPICWRPYTGVDYDISRAMCDYFCNYFRTGDPNGGQLVQWTPYTRGNEKAMWMQSNFQMNEVPRSPMVDFQIAFILGLLPNKE